MTGDLMPRVAIERNLAMSLLMQLEQPDLADVARKLPNYTLSSTVEERADTSADRVMSVLGWDVHDEDAVASRTALRDWFFTHDAEIDHD